ncbi:MAG TPA: hypothetical protein VFL86_26765, partial [Burkholderiaceae bacterium]|nr:hypothetical protein [Burkholderiaceae bacterium]
MKFKKVLQNVEAALASFGPWSSSQRSRPASPPSESRSAGEALTTMAARRTAAGTPQASGGGDGLRPRSALTRLQHASQHEATLGMPPRGSSYREIQPALTPVPSSRRDSVMHSQLPGGGGRPRSAYVSLADLPHAGPVGLAPVGPGAGDRRHAYVSLADLMEASAARVNGSMSRRQVHPEPSQPVPSPRRQALLEDYQAQIRRPLDLEHAVKAIKLRCVAEIHCKKNEWARLMPHLPASRSDQQRFDKLVAMPV